MKRSLKRIALTCLAAILPCLGWAADPVATWTEFTDTSATSFPSDDYALATNGNTVATDGITIGETSGVTITTPSGSSLGDFTVIALVSGVGTPTTNASFAGFNSGVNNIRLKYNGSNIIATYDDKTDTWGSTQAWSNDAGYNTIAVTYERDSNGTGTLMYVNGATAMTANGLRWKDNSTNTIILGSDGYSAAVPMTGMKVHQVQVYTSELSAADVATASANLLAPFLTECNSSISEAANFSDLTWTSGETTLTAFPENATATLSVTGTPTLTLDTTVAMRSLTVAEGAAGAKLTVAADASITDTALTAFSTIIKTDTDVSDITASLGAVTIAEGKTLTIGANTTLTSVSGEGTLCLNGAELAISSDVSVNIEIGPSGGTIRNTTTKDLALSSVITGSGKLTLIGCSSTDEHVMTKDNKATLTGSLAITGASPDFTGTVEVSAGVVYIGMKASLSGNTTASTANIGTASTTITVKSGATFLTHLGGGTTRQTFANPIVAEDGAVIGNKDGRVDYTGDLTLSGAVTYKFGWSKNNIISGVISGDGSLTIMNSTLDTDTPTLIFSNTNTYTGGTTIASGATLQVEGLVNLGSEGTVKINSDAVLNLYIKDNKSDDHDKDWTRLEGTGTVAYNAAGAHYRTFPEFGKIFPETLTVENNLTSGLILPTKGATHTIGSLKGSGAFRVDWDDSEATSPRSLKIVQSSDTTYSGSLLTNNALARFSTVYLSGAEGATNKTLTYTGNTTAGQMKIEKPLVIEDSGVFNLVGAWAGAITNNGTLGGTGSIGGALTLAANSTLDATAGALTVSGAVTFVNDTTVAVVLPEDADIDTTVITCGDTDTAAAVAAKLTNDTYVFATNSNSVTVAPVCTVTIGDTTTSYASVQQAIDAGATEIAVATDKQETVVLSTGSVTLTNFTGTVTDVYGNELALNDGTYTAPAESDYVAQVGDSKYLTIETAAAAAGTTKSITLLADASSSIERISSCAGIVVPTGTTLTVSSDTTVENPDGHKDDSDPKTLRLPPVTGAGEIVKTGAGSIVLFNYDLEPTVKVEEGIINLCHEPTDPIKMVAESGTSIRFTAWNTSFSKSLNEITLKGGSELVLANGLNNNSTKTLAGTITIEEATETPAKIYGSSFGKVEITAGITGTGKLEFAEGRGYNNAGTSYPCENEVAVSGAITGDGLSVIVSDTPNAVTFSGANTYTGGTTIAEDATLNITNAGALGTGAITGEGTVVLTGSTENVNNPAGFNLTGVTLNLNNQYTWNATDGSGYLTNAVPMFTLGSGATVEGGNVTPYQGTARTVEWIRYTGGNTAAPATVSANLHSVYSPLEHGRTVTVAKGAGPTEEGVAEYDLEISGTLGVGGEFASTTLVKEGPGILKLSGENNLPALTINAGTVLVANAAALSATTTVAEGATLDLNGQTVTETVALSVSGTLTGTGELSAGTLTLADGATLDSSFDALTVTGLNVAENVAVKLSAAIFPAKALELTSAATTTVQYPVTVKVGDAVQTGTYALQVTQGETDVQVVEATPVITEPTEVTEVPTEITVDPDAFGYGKHTVLTYTGEGTANWNTLTTINGLPDGVTEDDIVTTETTWGFTNNTLKVLPIGDSITAGLVTYNNSSADFHVPGGYRLPLYQFLTQAYGEGNVKYLGTSDVSGLNSGANSYENNTAVGLGDQTHHEGHSGAFVMTGAATTATTGKNGIYERFTNANVIAAIAAQGTPDVITIHLGTNDIGDNQSDETVFAEMKQLIYLLNGAGDAVDGVTPLYPNAKIFVAKIMPRNHIKDTATIDTRIEAFNTSLTNYVTGDVAEKVVLVDLQTDLSYGLMRFDWLHPSTEGYTRMAQSWFAAIEADEDVAPMDATETIVSVDSRVAGRLTVVVDKALDKTKAETVENWTLTGGATVTTASLARDKRTVTLDVTGVVSGTAYTLTATGVWTAEASTSTTFETADIHVPTADVAESDPTTTDKLTGGVLKAAEWTTFTGLTKGTPYTSPIGYMPESGRAWQLEVRDDTPAPIVTDGVLSLNGVPLTVNPVDGRLGTTKSRNTIVMEVSNLAAGDVLLTSAKKNKTAFDSSNPEPTVTQITKLSVKDKTTLVWKDRTNADQEFTLTGVDLTDAIPETIVLKGCWVKGANISLMVNGTSYALTVGDSASEEYQDSWLIGAESTADTGSSMNLHRLSFYEGEVTGFVTTTWQGATGVAGDWATASNWSNGVPTADTAAIIPAGASITLTADATAKSITIDGTVAISGAFTLTVTEPIVIAEGEILKTTNTKLAAPVSGAGELHIVGTKYSGHGTGDAVLTDVPCSITGLTNSVIWTGTVILEAIDGVNNLSLVDFGNSESAITLKNVTGNLDHDLVDPTWNPITVKSDLHLEGTNTLNNGYDNQLHNFTGKITGTGSLVWQKDSSANGMYCFTGDISEFMGNLTDDSAAPRIAIGKIATSDIDKGVIRINGDKEINCTLKAGSSIQVSGTGTLKGSGTLNSEVTIQTGATIDATDPTKILTLAEGVEVVWPEQGTLNVKVGTLPTEGNPVTLFKQTGLTDEVKQITTLSVTAGDETVTSGYQVEAKESVGYVLAVREKENPVYPVATAAELKAAIDAIKEITDADVNATVNLTAALTGETALTGTLVVDIGDTNSLTINMGGYPITAGNFTAIQLVSGQLTITSAAEAAISRTGSTGATILVASLPEITPASPTLTLEAGVKVNANASESAAVDLQIGTIGGSGTLNGNLKLAHHTTIDATIGHLTIANEGIVQFPGLRDDGTGGSVNSTVTILMPDGLVYPQEIIKCANASADHAPEATLYVNDFSGNNYGLTVMVDNQDGTVSAYGLKQYVCVADAERYTTVAAAIADKQTNIYLHANPVENIVIPDGVTLNLAYLGVQYTVVGNVTVQDGGCLRPMGGDVFGNVTFESGSRLDVAFDLQNADTTEFIVGGKVTFPASNFVVVVGSAAEDVAIGEPQQIIRSAVPLEYAEISVTDLQIATGTNDDDDVTDVNEDTKIVTTSFTYEVVNKMSGACTLDGVDYKSIEQALTALADAGNDVITLNKALTPDATIVINVDDPATDELEEVTIDLNGHNLTSTADPAIRIESGKLNLVSTGSTAQLSATAAIFVGADAEMSATIDAALHIDQSVSVAGEIDVVSGTISGDATLLGSLALWDGAIIDASTTQLTMGAIEVFEQFIGHYAVTFPGAEGNKGTITVIPPAGSAYPVQFIACPDAGENYYANTNLLIKMGETTSAVGEFTFVLKKESEAEGAAVTGYAIATNYAVVRVDAETRNSKAYYATFEDAFVDDPRVEELESDILVLLANVAMDGPITANIYTNGYDLTGTGTISGSLTLTQGTEIPVGTSISAAGIQIDADATVTINGAIASTGEIPIVCYGTVGGTGTITGALRLMDGATIAQGANFAPTGGTVVYEEATVTIDGALSGSLYVPNATIEGEGAVTIGNGNTLTGAGTIEPTVTFATGAIIDKSGFEEDHLVLSKVTALTGEVITVKATDLAHVLTAKNAEAPFTAANFTVDMGTSGYVAYDLEDPADYDNNLVIQTVAYNNGYTLGIVKLNYYIGGVRIADPTRGDAEGVSVAKQLAEYGYRYGILEIKGVDTASSDPVAGFQLFTNVVNGFVGDYLVITYDFGMKNIMVMDGTVGEGDAAVTTRYVVVTADVDGPYDGDADTRGHAGYRDTTNVNVLVDGTEVTATALDLAEAQAFGLVDAEAEVLPTGVKYFAVPYAEVVTKNGTYKFTVKATNKATNE